MKFGFHVLEQGRIEANNAPFVTETGHRVYVTAIWPVRCYLVRHPAGDHFWDTGLPEVVLLENLHALGGMPKHIVSQIEPWLESHGLKRETIRYVGLSHLHIDHGGNANDFSHSTFLIAADEYRHATSEQPAGPYHPAGYDRLNPENVQLVEGVTDVFGDGTVVIHPAPGHSLGHQVLQVTLPDYQPMLLMGDASYVQQDLIDRRAPIWNANLPETFRTMDRLQALAASINATMLFHHDPAAPSTPSLL